MNKTETIEKFIEEMTEALEIDIYACAVDAIKRMRKDINVTEATCFEENFFFNVRGMNSLRLSEDEEILFEHSEAIFNFVKQREEKI